MESGADNGTAAERPLHFMFDWNGTLQDDLHAAVAGTNALLADQGRPPIHGLRKGYRLPRRSSEKDHSADAGIL